VGRGGGEVKKMVRVLREVVCGWEKGSYVDGEGFFWGVCFCFF
jgi:hypothetical protein